MSYGCSAPGHQNIEARRLGCTTIAATHDSIQRSCSHGIDGVIGSPGVVIVHRIALNDTIVICIRLTTDST